jgi:hypothetical protein
MYNEIHAMHGHLQAFSIPDISDEKSNSWVISVRLLHLILLELVSRVDRDSRRIVVCQDFTQKGFTE